MDNLNNLLGGESVAGGKLKETGTTHWITPNTGATNETGFTALPGEGRDIGGAYGDVVGYGFWWSSTGISTTLAFSLAWSRFVYYSGTNVNRDGNNKYYGFSVRCVKD